MYGYLGDVEPMFVWWEKSRAERDPTAVYAGFLRPGFSPMGMPIESVGLERYRTLVEGLGIIRA